MALTDLTPATRIEEILAGAEISPATRLEYFLQQATKGGGATAPVIIDVPLEGTLLGDQPADGFGNIVTTVDLSAAQSAEGPVFIRFPAIVYNEGSENYVLSSTLTQTALVAYVDGGEPWCQSFIFDADSALVNLVISFTHIEEV